MNINDILTRKQVIDLMNNTLKFGQRLNIKNNDGNLYMIKGIFEEYNYKAPSKKMYEFTKEEVLKLVLNGREKYKLIALPSGINSFAYELEKLF